MKKHLKTITIVSIFFIILIAPFVSSYFKIQSHIKYCYEIFNQTGQCPIDKCHIGTNHESNIPGCFMRK